MRSLAARAALAIALAGCVERLNSPELARGEVEVRRDALGPAVIEAFRDLKARLLRVEYRIRTANAPLCGPLVVPELGVIVAGDSEFSEGSVQRLASQALGLSDHATVVYALPSAAFARSGGRVGDSLADPSQRSLTDFVRGKVEDPRARKPVPVQLLRDGHPLEVRVRPDVACAVRALFAPEGALLPWQHESFVSAIPAGALRYLDDDQLAVMIGHQFAHALIELAPHPPADREPLADRIGLFMTARAGFAYSVAPALWEQIAAEYPWTIEGSPSAHGEIARRLPEIRAVVGEIGSLIAAGKPLHPGTF